MVVVAPLGWAQRGSKHGENGVNSGRRYTTRQPLRGCVLELGRALPRALIVVVLIGTCSFIISVVVQALKTASEAERLRSPTRDRKVASSNPRHPGFLLSAFTSAIYVLACDMYVE